jgi:2',3'-cyclic-nucleotide 2'-phosphodiesterase (5'-nucleotidase family)
MFENKIKPKNLSCKLIANALVRLTFLLIFAIGVNCQLTIAQQSTATKATREASVSPSKPGSASEKATVTRSAVDETLPADASVERIVAPYSIKVRELENVIGRLDGELRKLPIGAGSLGNFVTDGLRTIAARKSGHPVPLFVTNSGGLRKNVISPGDLRAANIFELLPFENALIQLDLSGQQLIGLLEVVLKGRDAQSGARVRYRVNAENNSELVDVKLLSAEGREIEVDPKATYHIVTIDYLLDLASGSYAILQEGKNIKPLGITMRDAMMEYVKSETAAGRAIKPIADDRFIQVGPANQEVKP